MPLTATKSIVINAAPQRVWEALTDPAQIKQYMWGAEAISDWKLGSSLTYRGTWEGKSYEDKGTILEIDPPRLLRTNYYSPLSGKADAPENYAEVTYQVRQVAGGSELTVTQTNLEDEAAKTRSEGNWSMALDSIKKLIEG